MASLNDIANNYFKKDGSVAFTGSSLKWVPPTIGGTPTTYSFVQAKQTNTNGYGISIGIGSGGSMCIGSGESMSAWYGSTDSGDNETTYISSDEKIVMAVNCQSGWASKKVSTFNADGTFTSTKVYNAVWNDYAEFYPKGEDTEPGDIIMLDINSKDEKYIKATEGSTTVVGVYSDTYGHLIGGEEALDGREFVEYNSEKYIPVGLVGRVYCKVIGKINKGDRIVVSEIAGVGRKFDAEKDNVFQIVGMAVENKESLQIDKIKVNFRGGGL